MFFMVPQEQVSSSQTVMGGAGELAPTNKKPRHFAAAGLLLIRGSLNQLVKLFQVATLNLPVAVER